MIRSGILNPRLLDLIARVRHTNTLVIADRGFPFWPQIETIDLSLVDNIPTVLQVLAALRTNFVVGRAYAAREFRRENPATAERRLRQALAGVELTFETHPAFKRRVPAAIGLIRTGDAMPYANLILESA
ncbi:MAG TPA: D-ribose pyranase [Candidatus Didemnitutus sp.]|jgi:D-ribose pyranase